MDYYVFVTDKMRLRDITDKKIDVWEAEAYQRSTVGIQGENVERMDLRNSFSIRDRFSIDKVHTLSQIFEKYVVGVGSKHVYPVGGYMKPHRDARLPDLDGLPHVMSLVVLENNDTEILFIDEVDVVKKHDNIKLYSYEALCVLFPINKLHEVREVKKIRQSFVFPVYGKINKYEQLVKWFTPRQKYKNMYETVIDQLDNCKEDELNETSRAELQASIDLLGNEALSQNYVLYRMQFDDYVCNDHGVDLDTESCTWTGSQDYTPAIIPRDKITLSDIRNMIVEISTKKRLINAPIEGLLDQLSDVYLDTHKKLSGNMSNNEKLGVVHLSMKCIERINQQIIDYAKNPPTPLTIVSHVDIAELELPDDIFVYICRELYYNDTTADNLIGIDQKVYSTAKQQSRKITVEINYMKYVKENRYIDSIYPVYVSKGNELTRFTSMNSKDLPYSPYITDIYPEYDDQGGYDAIYNRVHHLLIIDARETPKRQLVDF